MPTKLTTPERPRQRLSLFDSICIIVGTIIGAGVFETTPDVASNVDGATILILMWIAGGLIAMSGALCFGELTTTYPEEGGDYVYLNRAYGRWMGFLFVWAQFWIIRPGNIGAMAFVFARYANQLQPLGLGQYNLIAYASIAVFALTVTNVLGVNTGKTTQNVLTAVKVAGLLAIFVTAFVFISPAQATSEPPSESSQMNLSLAFIFILFTYGGWNDLSFVAAEVRHPEKNLFRALVIGTSAVIVIYVLVNLAFVYSLGLNGFASSDAVAADLLHMRFGNWGKAAISLLICVSCLGAINGMTLTGARIYYALGTEHSLFAWLGKWNGRLGAPIRSLVGQAVITLALVITIGRYDDGFNGMVAFAAPYFWLFLLLVGISLFVLRFTDRQPRSCSVLFYPVTPLLFCASCLFMLYSSADYAFQPERRTGSLWAGGLVLVGVVIAISTALIDRNRSKR